MSWCYEIYGAMYTQSREKHLSALRALFLPQVQSTCLKGSKDCKIQCTSLKHLLYALFLLFLFSLLHSKINFSNLLRLKTSKQSMKFMWSMKKIPKKKKCKREFKNSLRMWRVNDIWEQKTAIYGQGTSIPKHNLRKKSSLKQFAKEIDSSIKKIIPLLKVLRSAAKRKKFLF